MVKRKKFKNSPFKKFKGFTISCKCFMHDAYFQVEKKNIKKKSKLNYKMQHIHIKEEDGVINLKPKSSYPQNI